MSHSITRQSDQFDYFDTPRVAKDHTQRALPREAMDYLRGPQITEGLLNTRQASTHEAIFDHFLDAKDGCQFCWQNAEGDIEEYGDRLMANHGDELAGRWHKNIQRNPGQGGVSGAPKKGPGRYRDRAAMRDRFGAENTPGGEGAIPFDEHAGFSFPYQKPSTSAADYSAQHDTGTGAFGPNAIKTGPESNPETYNGPGNINPGVTIDTGTATYTPPMGPGVTRDDLPSLPGSSPLGDLPDLSGLSESQQGLQGHAQPWITSRYDGIRGGGNFLARRPEEGRPLPFDTPVYDPGGHYDDYDQAYEDFLYEQAHEA